MPNSPDRIQQEVDDLLAKLEKFPPKRPLGRRIGDAVSAPFRAAGNFIASFNLPRISAGHVLLAAVVVIVIAFVAGGNSSLWQLIIVGGVLLFIAAFVMSLRRQSRPPTQKYWRDRPMDLDSPSDGGGRGFFDRFRRR